MTNIIFLLLLLITQFTIDTAIKIAPANELVEMDSRAEVKSVLRSLFSNDRSMGDKFSKKKITNIKNIDEVDLESLFISDDANESLENPSSKIFAESGRTESLKNEEETYNFKEDYDFKEEYEPNEKPEKTESNNKYLQFNEITEPILHSEYTPSNTFEKYTEQGSYKIKKDTTSGKVEQTTKNLIRNSNIQASESGDYELKKGKFDKKTNDEFLKASFKPDPVEKNSFDKTLSKRTNEGAVLEDKDFSQGEETYSYSDPQFYQEKKINLKNEKIFSTDPIKIDANPSDSLQTIITNFKEHVYTVTNHLETSSIGENYSLNNDTNSTNTDDNDPINERTDVIMNFNESVIEPNSSAKANSTKDDVDYVITSKVYVHHETGKEVKVAAGNWGVDIPVNDVATKNSMEVNKKDNNNNEGYEPIVSAENGVKVIHSDSVEIKSTDPDTQVAGANTTQVDENKSSIADPQTESTVGESDSSNSTNYGNVEWKKRESNKVSNRNDENPTSINDENQKKSNETDQQSIETQAQRNETASREDNSQAQTNESSTVPGFDRSSSAKEDLTSPEGKNSSNDEAKKSSNDEEKISSNETLNDNNTQSDENSKDNSINIIHGYKIPKPAEFSDWENCLCKQVDNGKEHSLMCWCPDFSALLPSEDTAQAEEFLQKTSDVELRRKFNEEVKETSKKSNKKPMLRGGMRS